MGEYYYTALNGVQWILKDDDVARELAALRVEVERLRAINTTGQRNWCVTCEESGDKRKVHFTGTGMCPECYGRMVDKVEDLQASLSRYREAVVEAHKWMCDPYRTHDDMIIVRGKLRELLPVRAGEGE